MNTPQQRYALEAERKISNICERIKIPVKTFKEKLTVHFGRMDSSSFNKYIGEVFTYDDGIILNAYQSFILAYEENVKGIQDDDSRRKKKVFSKFLINCTSLMSGEDDDDLSDLTDYESSYNPIDMGVNEDELEYELKRMENEEDI